MKIVIAEKISPAGLRILSGQPGWMVIDAEEFSRGPAEHLADADALIVRSAVRADKEMLAQAPKLRVIGRAGVGVDNVDVEAATKRGIVVMNTPGANAVAVAEHTLGLMLSLARMIPHADATTRAGNWEKKSLQGTQLLGKILGIIGLGRVGIEVARRAAGMGMTTIAYDPFVSPSAVQDLQIELVPLDDLFASADYISLHLGLTEQTMGMINAKTLAKMKHGVRIVNCARGELVQEGPMAQALNEGRIGGAAFDVFNTEPPHGSPLLTAKNVIATPHIGGSTVEAQDVVGIQIAQQVVEYLKSGIAQNAVNLPSISDEEFARLSPYMQLAERMASLLSRMVKGSLEEVRVQYCGQIGGWNTALIRSSAVKGTLQQSSQELVNIINAEQLARERGIRVSHIVEEGAPRQAINELAVSLMSAGEQYAARGTVVHGRSCRLIELSGIDIEAVLEGRLLVLSNRDSPGVIGYVGGLLGGKGINIARFALGRPATTNTRSDHPSKGRANDGAGTAIAIVQCDTAVSDEIVGALLANGEILTAFTASFVD